MTRHQFPSSRSLALRCCVGLVFSFVLAATAQAGNTFSVTNLVTSSQSANIAPVTDPNLVNPWGVSFSPTSPLWVSDNGTGVSTLYSITNTNQVSIVSNPSLFPVIIPGGTPTGQINNSNTSAFNGDAFVFVSQSGAVTGWQPSFGNTAQVIQAANSANSYTGATEVTVNGDTYLLAANNKTGNIDVIAGTPGAPALAGTFKDSSLPAGSMPSYNVQTLNWRCLRYAYTNNIVDKLLAPPGRSSRGSAPEELCPIRGDWLSRRRRSAASPATCSWVTWLAGKSASLALEVIIPSPPSAF